MAAPSLGQVHHRKIFYLIVLGCIWFEDSCFVYQLIDGKKDSREAFKRSASVDIIWITRRDRCSGEQTTWMKQSLPQRYVCAGCQLKSDQALRLLCLKGHVRARDSTLWRYCWQEASEFLCTKNTSLEGVQQTKKSPKPPRNALCGALIMSSDPRKKRNETLIARTPPFLLAHFEAPGKGL